MSYPTITRKNNIGKQYTITKKITDMSVYGITGENRWSGDVIVKSETSVTCHGKYFPTKEQAEAYAEKLIKAMP